MAYLALMDEFIISVGKIEELQMLNDKAALDAIFYKAKTTIVNGEKVALIRETRTGDKYRFEEISTLPDLEDYKKNVYKYVK
jgi:hypothetical protein